jgi:hypothetical protein
MKPVAFPEPLWAIGDAPAPEPAKQPLPRWGFIEWFVIAQTAMPADLFFAALQTMRLPIRLGRWREPDCFGSRMVAGSGAAASEFHVAAVSLAYLALMIFHPATNICVGEWRRADLPLRNGPRVAGPGDGVQRRALEDSCGCS